MDKEEATDDLSIKEILTDAISYWERRRIYYNVILALIVICTLAIGWREIFTQWSWFDYVIRLFVLAVIANVLYTTAYIVDIPVQKSAFRDTWRKRRVLLWIAGTLFAAVLAYIVAAIQLLTLIL